MAKRYEELTFTDDFMFCKVLQNNPDVCKELTELILGKKIGSFVEPEIQKAIEITADGHGVRFDVYFEDDENTIFDIEMQQWGVRNLPRRTRYYQGMIDLNHFEKGLPYDKLKSSYIVFISKENPYEEKGLHKYSFRNICMEDTDLEMGDGTNKIFLCANGTHDDVSGDLKAFLQYVSGKAPSSKLTEKLDALVRRARTHKEWRQQYMTLLEHYEHMREEGREEGRAEGREEGRAEERLNTDREKDRADKAEQLLADTKRQADDAMRQADAARKQYAALEQKYRKLKEQVEKDAQ